MEIDKVRETNRIKFTRIMDNKRTISSEQGHYQRTQHQRKFTIEYIDPKKSLRQPLVQRKNQSLPRALVSNSQTNINQSIRSRKLIYSSHSGYNDVKSSNKTIPAHISPSELHVRVDHTRNKSFCEGIQLFASKKYKEALDKFMLVQKQVKEAFPKNLYYIGLCHWHLQHTQKAVFNLSKSMDLGYQFPTQSYQLLSTFYEQTKNYNCALKTLNEWLKVESSARAHLMRARINYHFKQYAKAIADYGQCYRIQPTKLQAYIEEAEATYRLQGLQPAVQKYNQLLLIYPRVWPQSQHSDINYVKYKKSLLLLQQKQHQPALTLLKQVSNPQLQSQVNYYIGIIYSTLGDLQQATLAFAKSIQANTSVKFAGQSYYQKFVIMFKKNDFYGIQYELDIIRDRFHDNQGLQVLRTIIQGIIFILKMNFTEGLKIFQQILPLNPNFARFQKLYSSTLSSFTIFALYSLHRFNEALQQFTQSQLKNKRMSDSNRYNYTVLKAIKNALQGQFNQSLKLFTEAEKIEPFNTHTYMVKAVVEIMFYNSIQQCKSKQSQNQKRSDKDQGKNISRKGSKCKQQANQQILLSAQELLNRCLQKQLQNDQILYVLAVLNYELGQYESGLKLIRKAIDSSDDHTIKHYYVKANLKVMLELYAQAISDYTNAILVMTQQQSLKTSQKDIDMQKIQSPIPECYLERAKCFILENNYQKAEADLRLFFSQLQNVRQHEQQIDLFMHVGCSDVILEIYKTVLEQQYDPYNKMKCFYLSKELNNCLNMMNALLQYHQDQSDSENEREFKYNPQKLVIDRDCLDALKKSSQGSTMLVQQALNVFEHKLQLHHQGDIFKKSDCMFYAGVMAFHLQEYGKAKNYFIDAKSQKLESGEISRSQTEDDVALENQLFSFEQINYNIGVCDLVQGKWSNYLEHYPDFKRYHHGVTQNLLVDSEQITPFIVKNRLCSIYPPQQLGNIQFRLSFCLPKTQLREVKFNKNTEIIRSITLKDIDMRPSAPWIQKSKKGIMFTSDVMKESIDLKSQKSNRKNNNGKKKGQNRYKDKEKQEC